MKTKGNVERESYRRINKIGEKYNYRIYWDPDLRTGMPIRMLEEIGALDAAEELKKLPWYPK